MFVRTIIRRDLRDVGYEKEIGPVWKCCRTTDYFNSYFIEMADALNDEISHIENCKELYEGN